MEQAKIIGYLVIGASALISLYFTVCKPMLENQKTMVELTCAVRELTNKLIALESNNTDSHRRIHTKLDAHESKLLEHETRIHDLETLGGK